jgi:formylglycine-generating enzyme required for sulfatase activity
MIRTTAFLLMLTAGTTGSFQGVPCEAPLNRAALEQLIAGGVPAARIRQFIATCGVELGTPDYAASEALLKQIGVSATVLAALAPPTAAKVGSDWISPFDRRRMMFIPAGAFQMGSPDNEQGRDADEARHSVTIANAFWLDAEEVTNEAFRRFVIARPEWQPDQVRVRNKEYLKDWKGTDFPEGAASRPVVWVDWYAARAYAAWAGKRLPTEAEWEYAARAGLAGAPDPDYHPWGLRNMLSGVWEWTSSVYRPYPYVAADGRDLPNAQGPRVMRGGATANAMIFRRPSNRSLEEPGVGTGLLGFRCAR